MKQRHFSLVFFLVFSLLVFTGLLMAQEEPSLGNLTLGLLPEEGLLWGAGLPGGNASGLSYSRGWSLEGPAAAPRQRVTWSGQNAALGFTEISPGLWQPEMALAGGGSALSWGVGAAFPDFSADAALWRASLISRPHGGLSLGAAGEWDNQFHGSARLSAGIRPLAFLPGDHPPEFLRPAALAGGIDFPFVPQGPWPLGLGRWENPVIGIEWSPFTFLTAALRWQWGTSAPQYEIFFNSQGLKSGTRGATDRASGRFAAVWEPRQTPPSTLAAPRVLEYPLQGEITEAPRIAPSPVEALLLGELPGKSLFTLLREVEELSHRPGLEALYLKDPHFSASPAARMEIAAALNRFRKTGKEVIVSFSHAGRMDYLFAAACADTIIMAPLGSLVLTSLGVSRTYWGGFLERWGVEFPLLRTSPYKNSPDNLSQSSMTEEERENLQGYLESLSTELFRRGQENRGGRLSQELRVLAAQGPWLNMNQAREAGLVDLLAYQEDAEEHIRERFGEKPAPWTDPSVYRRETWKTPGGAKVAFLRLEGPIHSGDTLAGSIGGRAVSRRLRQIGQEGSCRAVLIHVNSGGGSILGSDIIARRVKALSDKGIPVVILMGGAAASGGYYIAAPADWIIASPLTLTGSIGVYASLPDFSKLREEQGVGWDGVAPDDSAFFADPLRGITDADKEKMQNHIDQSYQGFLDVVQEGRGLTEEELSAAAGARIWTGRQAKELKLVDEMGGYREAAARLRSLLEVPRIELVDYSPDPDQAAFNRERFVMRLFSGVLPSGSLVRWLLLPNGIAE